MTNNQLHGKKFEDLIKACGLFSGAADRSRSVTAGMDIEAIFDKQRGLPTSIKTTGSRTVTLDDARRFWALNYSFRMLVGLHDQVDGQKHFGVVHEFILTPDHLNELRGAIVADDVARLHHGISLGNFSSGEHFEAREWIGQQLRLLPLDQSHIILNPKIDSKEQRRLQCSVSIDALIDVTRRDGNQMAHTDYIGSLPLPIRLISSRREFGR